MLFIESDKFKRLTALERGHKRDLPLWSDIQLLSRLRYNLRRLTRPLRGVNRYLAPMSPIKLLLKFIERFYRLTRPLRGDKIGYFSAFVI